jgi:glycosyltransferase involved in cell wall biosynthesis
MPPDLPPPPPGKAGWPWGPPAGPLPAAMRDGSPWPRLSVVTPSFNQARFLEETIRSVLLQGYPNLEYIVIDGGSGDGSVEIIRKYEPWLAYWVSEPDGGHMNGLNKGFARSTGEIMAWQNSDDKYCPWAFQTVGRIFASTPQVQWLTTCTLVGWNEHGEIAEANRVPGYARTWFYRGWHLGNQPGFRCWIQQESTFWRRGLWQAAGGRVDDQMPVAGDFELWSRFWRHADLVTTTCPLSGFRQHGTQLTAQLNSYYAAAEAVLSRFRGQAVQHPWLVWLLQRLLKLTGRGGRRFGSRLARVDYNGHTDSWIYRNEYCI